MATTVQPASGEATKQLINYRVDAGVAVIELCDPPANTYTYEMNRQLDEAILKARMDNDVYVIVLTGAGLLLRTLSNLRSIHAGFDTRNLLVLRITPDAARYRTPAQTTDYYRRVLDSLRDGDRPVITAIYDSASDGAKMGIGGTVGGDLYIDLASGYDFDPRIGPGPLITEAEPYGNHGTDPEQISMRTIMVLNGPGIRRGQKLVNVRIIDFAPTLAWLLHLSKPKNATGRVLNEALEQP